MSARYRPHGLRRRRPFVAGHVCAAYNPRAHYHLWPAIGMITSEGQLEERLSRPTPTAIEAMRCLEGPLLVLGAAGKMGPSLVRLARRSADEAGRRDVRIIAVSR